MSNVVKLPRQRVREYRERKAHGLSVLQFVGDEATILENLYESGLLQPEEFEDRAKVSLALQRWERIIHDTELEW